VVEHFANNNFKAAKGVGASFGGEANKWKAIENFYDQLDLGRMMLAKVARRSDKLQSWVHTFLSRRHELAFDFMCSTSYQVTKQGADFPFHASAATIAKAVMTKVQPSYPMRSPEQLCTHSFCCFLVHF
jgi:hypothetical protein